MCVNQRQEHWGPSQNSASDTMKAPKRVSYKYMEIQRAQMVLWPCHAGTAFLPQSLYDVVLVRMRRRKDGSGTDKQLLPALLLGLPPTDASLYT